MQERVAVYRKENFNAAHRLHNPAWDEETNDKIFGLCNNPFYHGHNYTLIVKLIGEVNKDTGYVMDMKALSDIIKEEVIERFDHKNLNEDCVEFAALNPTAENIAITIYNLLKKRLNKNLTLSIKLYETERNFVEYPVV